jgi:outer membrane protein assembly factor BamE (lipoprotein component of BamABCDE complex)
MTNPRYNPLLFVAVFLLSAGCMTAGEHAATLHSKADEDLTVGVVQREIRKGMTQADVATSLGSPNIVTSEPGDRDVWIYDKIATEASYSRSSSSGILGGGGIGNPGDILLLGLGGLGETTAAGARAVTQRTLTVVIRFDEKKQVSSFHYHSSKF